MIINGNLDLYRSKIRSLGSLTEVKGWLDLSDTPIEDLGNIRRIDGYLFLCNSGITNEYIINHNL